MSDQARREHYGEFYGLRDLPRSDRPLLVVLGNCQAEALRICLTTTDGEPAVDTVRVPPVHEMTADDVPHLQALLGRVDVLVAQPVRPDYHGLPVGTEQAADRLDADAEVVMVPSVYYAGLYPYQEMMHVDGVGDPPVVPYHDLRSLAAAAELEGGPAALSAQERRTAYRVVATASLSELARRERQHDTVPASDLVAAAGADAGWTVNHPGNAVLMGLAERVRDRVRLPGRSVDPGRVLLRSVRTPLLGEVVEALDLTGADPGVDWVVDGSPVRDADIALEHAAFYAEHPRLVAAGVDRHRDRLRTLGWST